jgi:Na+-transporting methylmalonyl-CoA/oxaloacetate decarboxylase gamma subunit
MIHSSILLAQVDGSPLVQAAVPSTTEIITIGFLFVMVVLATLAVVTSTIGMFFARSTAKLAAQAAAAVLRQAELAGRAHSSVPVAATPPAASATPPAAAGSEASDDVVLLAVIAAAVHTVIGDRPHRVISIRRDGPGWAQEGRRQIFSSHRVR